MELFKSKDLRQLIEISGEWCISLYEPTHRFGREQQQDPIRFKNLLNQTEAELLNYDVGSREVEELLRSPRDLLNNGDFWQHQSDGLAVFFSPGYFRSLRLPIRFNESSTVAKNFVIKPLLPLLSNDGRFYILALSQNEIRLFLGTKFSIDELELSGIRTNMQEVLWMDDPEKHLDFHTGTAKRSPLGSDRSAIFHGQGVQTDDDKQNIMRYFQYINDSLNSLLQGDTIPMVAAGVDYLLPIYRKANTYPGLLDDGLTGNPEKLDEKILHQQALELVKPIFNTAQHQAVVQFEQLKGQKSSLASDDLRSTVKAAAFGQVDTLFVPLGIQKLGRFDPESHRVNLDQNQNPENRDLFDFAAVQTILNSGQVYAVQPEAIPGDGELAAIFRQGTQV